MPALLHQRVLGDQQHSPDDVRATVLRVAAPKALKLDFGELAGILKDQLHSPDDVRAQPEESQGKANGPSDAYERQARGNAKIGQWP